MQDREFLSVRLRSLVVPTAFLLLAGGIVGFWSRGQSPDDLISDSPDRSLQANRYVMQQEALAVPELLTGIRSPSSRLRARCLRYLGKFGDNGNVEAVVACLHDPDAEVRIQAAAALETLRSWRDVRPLLASAFDETERIEVRMHLIRAFGQHHESRAVPQLCSVVANPRLLACQRHAAIKALGLIDDLRAGPVFVALLQNPREPKMLRSCAARGLGCIRYLPASPLLISISRNRNYDPYVRLGAAIGLGSMEDARAVDLLRRLAGDAAEPMLVRLGAVHALYRVGVEVPHDWVREAVRSRDAEVRAEAFWLIGYLQDGDFAADVKQALRLEKDDEVRCAIRHAACRLRGEDADAWN